MKMSFVTFAFLGLFLVGSEISEAAGNNLASDSRLILNQFSGQIQAEKSDLLLESAQSENPQAQWEIGKLFLSIFTYNPPTEKTEQARRIGNKWIRKAAKGGCPYAMLDLGLLENGIAELPEQQAQEMIKKGVNILLEKKEKNALDAFYLSKCYGIGAGVEQDIEQACSWRQIALEKMGLSQTDIQQAMLRWKKILQKSS